ACGACCAPCRRRAAPRGSALAALQEHIRHARMPNPLIKLSLVASVRYVEHWVELRSANACAGFVRSNPLLGRIACPHSDGLHRHVALGRRSQEEDDSAEEHASQPRQAELHAQSVECRNLGGPEALVGKDVHGVHAHVKRSPRNLPGLDSESDDADKHPEERHDACAHDQASDQSHSTPRVTGDARLCSCRPNTRISGRAPTCRRGPLHPVVGRPYFSTIFQYESLRTILPSRNSSRSTPRTRSPWPVLDVPVNSHVETP